MKYQKKDLEKFPFQIEFALSKYRKHKLNYKDFDQVVLTGLGGSGIAGRIVKTYLQSIALLPIEVISDYKLPAYVNEKTLVVLNSYSGNTEETLSAYLYALERHAKLMVITTGGVLLDLAQETKIRCYKAETGFQPRMALGYSLTYLFLIFGEFFNIEVKDELVKAVTLLKNTDYYIDKATIYHCDWNPGIDDKIIIVTDPECYPLGVRFAQQINENVKMEAFVHELPEANHNVIETYNKHLNSSFIFLYTKHSPRLNHRFNFLEKLVLGHKQKLIRVGLKNYCISHIYEIIFTLDWISLLMADKRKVKSNEIPNIKKLKEYMAGK